MPKTTQKKKKSKPTTQKQKPRSKYHLHEDQFEYILTKHTVYEDCRTYIETGLARGKQLAIAANVFDRCIGIERDEYYFTYCLEQFKTIDHIELHPCDSRLILPELCKKLADQSCFWYLDAHFCRLDPPVEPGPFPLWKELSIIKNQTDGQQIVYVDDLHIFGVERPELLYKKGDAEWETVSVDQIERLFDERLLDSKVIGNGLTLWLK